MLAEGAEAVVPVIWLYEVVSVLAKAQKSKSIASEKAEAFLSERVPPQLETERAFCR